MKKKCVAIVSGGMDSITLYYHLKKEGYAVHLLSFDYGSKHNKKELPFVKKNVDRVGDEEDVCLTVPLSFIGEHFNSALLAASDEAIPDGHYTHETMKSTVVPFRNGIMLSIAVGYAESIGADKVFLGSHAGDHTIYPDCREEFTKAISKAASLGTYVGVEIISPFNNISKTEVCAYGESIGVPYELTWSCYKGGDIHCGTCGTCVERKEAFADSGVEDPTEYLR